MSEKKTNAAASEQDAVAAAVAGATVADTPERKNPIADLFDAPHFEPVANPTEYTNRDGSRVVTVANVTLPLKGMNVAAVGGQIRLRRLPNRRGSYAEFAFRQGSGIKALDDAANVMLIEWRKSVAEAYSKRQNGPISVGVTAGAVAIDATGWADDDTDATDGKK